MNGLVYSSNVISNFDGEFSNISASNKVCYRRTSQYIYRLILVVENIN